MKLILPKKLIADPAKLNRALARSVVAGAFVGVFFVVTQLVQNVLSSDALGLFGGGDAGGYASLVGQYPGPGERPSGADVAGRCVGTLP